MDSLKFCFRNNPTDSYEKWCSYRPPMRTVRTPAKANGSVVIVNDEVEEDADDDHPTAGVMDEESPPIVKSKGRKESTSLRCRMFNSDSEVEEVGDESKQGKLCLHKPKYSRRDCLDLSSTSPPKRRRDAKSKHNSSAVSDYRSVMMAVGSSATR